MKPRVKEVIPLINKTIGEVNAWTQEQQQEYVEKNHPELLERVKVEEVPKTLPPLGNVDKWPMIKVIALAMYFGGKEEALTAGVDAHLLKGFEAEILYKTILRIQGRSFSNSLMVEGTGRGHKNRSSPRQE